MAGARRQYLETVLGCLEKVATRLAGRARLSSLRGRVQGWVEVLLSCVLKMPSPDVYEYRLLNLIETLRGGNLGLGGRWNYTRNE